MPQAHLTRLSKMEATLSPWGVQLGGQRLFHGVGATLKTLRTAATPLQLRATTQSVAGQLSAAGLQRVRPHS